MISYFFLIFIPIIFHFISDNKNSSIQRVSLIFVGIIFILFTGLRHEVSIDWGNYLRIYNAINQSESFKDALFITEPSFAALNWLAGQYNLSIHWINLIISIIFITGLFKFLEKMPLPWLALISVTPYLVIVISMSAIRQTAAIGFVLYLMAGWNKDTLFKKITLSLLAISFHYSAFVVLLFVIQSIKMPSWVRWSVFLVGGVISFIALSQTDQYANYEQIYVTGGENIESHGALQHVLLNAIPAAIYLFFIKKWNEVYVELNLTKLLSYFSLLSVIGVLIYSTAVDRLSLYLSPIQMLVYGSIPVVFKNQSYGLIIIIIHIAILFVWLNYSNSAYAFLPYKNILFY